LQEEPQLEVHGQERQERLKLEPKEDVKSSDRVDEEAESQQELIVEDDETD